MMDTLSAASITRDFVSHRDVALRSRVMLVALASCKLVIQLAGINHPNSGSNAAPAAVRWMQGRFAGTPAPSNC